MVNPLCQIGLFPGVTQFQIAIGAPCSPLEDDFL